METEAARFNATLADGRTDAIVYGESIGDVLVNSLKRAAAEAISSGLFDLLSGGNPNRPGGGVGGLVSGIFGGFFANGGNPPVGKAYIVGERGPAHFVPPSPGAILPTTSFVGGPNLSLTRQHP